MRARMAALGLHRSSEPRLVFAQGDLDGGLGLDPPSSSLISGEAKGAAAVIQRASFKFLMRYIYVCV